MGLSIDENVILLQKKLQIGIKNCYKSWTEIRPVLNKAQRWVKESIEDIKNTLPYKMLGIDSDNGA